MQTSDNSLLHLKCPYLVGEESFFYRNEEVKKLDDHPFFRVFLTLFRNGVLSITIFSFIKLLQISGNYKAPVMISQDVFSTLHTQIQFHIENIYTIDYW